MLSGQVLGEVPDRLFVPVHLRLLRGLPALNEAEPAKRRPRLLFESMNARAKVVSSGVV